MPGPRDSEHPWRTAPSFRRDQRVFRDAATRSGAGNCSCGQLVGHWPFCWGGEYVPYVAVSPAIALRLAQWTRKPSSLTPSRTRRYSGRKARPWHVHVFLVSAAIVAMGGRLAFQGYRLFSTQWTGSHAPVRNPLEEESTACFGGYNARPEWTGRLFSDVRHQIRSFGDLRDGVYGGINHRITRLRKCGLPAETIFFTDRRSNHSEPAGQRPWVIASSWLVGLATPRSR